MKIVIIIVIVIQVSTIYARRCKYVNNSSMEPMYYIHTHMMLKAHYESSLLTLHDDHVQEAGLPPWSFEASKES